MKGLEVPLRRRFQYLVVQRQVGHRSLQEAVLRLQTLEASGLDDPEARVLTALPARRSAW